MHRPPSPESSALLRALISAKRRQGQLAQALVLARLGAQAAQEAQGDEDLGVDELSRRVLARYLEQSPDDDVARQAFTSLPQPLLVLLGESTEVAAGQVFELVLGHADPQGSESVSEARGEEVVEQTAEQVGEEVAEQVAEQTTEQITEPASASVVTELVPETLHERFSDAAGSQTTDATPDVKRAAAGIRWVIVIAALVVGSAGAGAWAYFSERPGASTRAVAPVAATLPAAASPSVSAAPPQQLAVLEAASAVRAVERQPLVIRAVGDVVLGSDYPTRRLPDDKDKARLLAATTRLLDADIVVGNLEGVLASGGRSFKDLSQPGRYAFRMPESYAGLLREMGFDVLNLANNHAFDFGPAGLDSTLRALSAEGLHSVGVAGADLLTVTVKGWRVAFLSYSYMPHFAHLDDERRVRREIELARAEADLVLVSVHAGREGQGAAGLPAGPEYHDGEYRGDLRKFARFAVEQGADAVFGHGPHVVRPLEIHSGKPIFYSLGNFVGYRSLSTRGMLNRSIVAEVRFNPLGAVEGIGVIPLKFDASGIPAADYSAATIEGLGGLIEHQLAKPPVLELAVPKLGETSPTPANPDLAPKTLASNAQG